MSDDEQLAYYRAQAKGIAAGIASRLEEYEAEHPKGAPCFNDVLVVLRDIERGSDDAA